MKRQTFWIEVTRAQFLKLPMNIRRKELRKHAVKFLANFGPASKDLEAVTARLKAAETRNAQWQKKWELSCETLGNSLEREKALEQQLEAINSARSPSSVTHIKEEYRRSSKGQRGMLRAWFARVLNGEDGNHEQARLIIRGRIPARTRGVWAA